MTKGITTGDVRGDLVRDHKKLIEKAMNQNNPKKSKPYYILVVANWDDNKIKTTALVMDNRFPIDLLSSILYKVDPVSGKYEVIYCKPKDVPTGHVVLDGKRTSVQDVIAQNNVDSYTPIIH